MVLGFVVRVVVMLLGSLCCHWGRCGDVGSFCCRWGCRSDVGGLYVVVGGYCSGVGVFMFVVVVL